MNTPLVVMTVAVMIDTIPTVAMIGMIVGHHQAMTTVDLRRWHITLVLVLAPDLLVHGGRHLLLTPLAPLLPADMTTTLRTEEEEAAAEAEVEVEATVTATIVLLPATTGMRPLLVVALLTETETETDQRLPVNTMTVEGTSVATRKTTGAVKLMQQNATLARSLYIHLFRL